MSAGESADLLHHLVPVVPTASRRCSTSTSGSTTPPTPCAGVGRPVSRTTARTATPSSAPCWCCASSPTPRPAASSAAATTSLPEDFGGSRNWDYRFCWLRDASLTLQALLSAGYDDEAMLWRDWLLRAIAGDPQDLQIMYAVDGVARPARTRARPPARLRRTHGRCGSGTPPSTSARRDVLGEVMTALELRPTEPAARRTRPGRCNARWSTSWPRTGRSPTTGCGRSAGRQAALHPLAADGLGRLRPGGPRRRDVRPRRAAVEKWRSLRDEVARRDPREGVRRRAQHVRPALRHHTRSTRRCC